MKDTVSSIATHVIKQKNSSARILPSLLHSCDAWPNSHEHNCDFTKGVDGTLFMALENISEALLCLCQEARTQFGDAMIILMIVFVSASFVGSRVCNGCVEKGGTFIWGVENRESDKTILFHGSPCSKTRIES